VNVPLWSCESDKSVRSSPTGIAVSGCVENYYSGCCLHSSQVLYMFVDDTIYIDLAWEHALEADTHMVSVVSSILSAILFSASICGVAARTVIGTPALKAISGFTISSIFRHPVLSTAFAVFLASCSASVATTLGKEGSPSGCISKIFGMTG